MFELAHLAAADAFVWLAFRPHLISGTAIPTTKHAGPYRPRRIEMTFHRRAVVAVMLGVGALPLLVGGPRVLASGWPYARCSCTIRHSHHADTVARRKDASRYRQVQRAHRGHPGQRLGEIPWAAGGGFRRGGFGHSRRDRSSRRFPHRNTKLSCARRKPTCSALPTLLGPPKRKSPRARAPWITQKPTMGALRSW